LVSLRNGLALEGWDVSVFVDNGGVIRRLSGIKVETPAICNLTTQ
jgi:hypothetical protein